MPARHPLGGVVQARRWARRAGGRAGGRRARRERASARRWPSERSRGWLSPGMPGGTRRSRARRSPLPPVGGRALVGDGLEVEQVCGGLRHQPDQGAACRRVEAGRVEGPDLDVAGVAAAAPLQRPDQRRLARAAAAHQGRDAAGAEHEVDVAQGHGGTVHDGDPRACSATPVAAVSVAAGATGWSRSRGPGGGRRGR